MALQTWFSHLFFVSLQQKPMLYNSMINGIINSIMNKKTFLILTAALASIHLFAQHAPSCIAKYIINTDDAQQTIEHFGASDAWSMQFIGLWPEQQQSQIADWLFSTDNDATGKPKGIGLSVWRFNLGAGSAEQGDSSHIDYGTRTECFLQPDGSYNWNKQLGQRRFLKLAKDRGVNHFLAFLNSVPVYFTQNGLATNTGRDKTMNIKSDCYDDAARFIVRSLNGLEKHDSIHFDYFCPVNEPEWEWVGPKQEGSPATNMEIAKLVRAVGKEMKKSHLSTQILVNETGDMRYLIGKRGDGHSFGNNMENFFNPTKKDTYIGGTPNVPQLIVGHSYWSNTPVDTMRAVRLAIKEEAKKQGLKFWQTELCIMQNDEEIGGGGGYDYSMRTALYVARVIHYDLVMANACSWSWWRAAGGDYKDGLIRLFSDPKMTNGWAVDSKLLWALGNYSRFIRPGATRYAINALDKAGNAITEGDTDPRGILCSAYRNANGNWVVVAINYSNSPQPFHFGIKDDHHPLLWKMYRTSDRSAESLLPLGTTRGDTELAPQSITTFSAE